MIIYVEEEIHCCDFFYKIDGLLDFGKRNTDCQKNRLIVYLYFILKVCITK